jgi:cell pole-organizing protein PopZ
MEEILASIRRIISDEEANAPKETPAEPTDDYPVRTASADADYEVADTQIIDDIARVLSGGSPPEAEMSEDDILDLDLGDALEAEPADEMVVVEETVVIESDVPFEIEADAPYEPRKLDFSTAFPPSGDAGDEMATSDVTMDEAISAEAPISEEGFAAETTPDFESPPAEEVMIVAAPAPALDDPTSALERAIAALKAGDLSAFAREADPTYSFGMTSPAAPVETAPAPEPVAVEPEPVPDPDPTVQAHPVLAAEDEPLALEEPLELEAAGWEPEGASAWTEETETFSETEIVPEPQSEAETSSAWSGEDSTWSKAAPTPIKEFLPSGPKTNGGSGHKHHHEFEAPVGSKSLEDSVKEMLRPMLRQWLDENMNRVLTAALREELENAPPPSTTRRGY